MKITALETFWITYREGSLNKAARVLHRSQPALSYHIRELEESLGGQLFERRGRSLVPTEMARRLAPQVGEILDRVRVLERQGRALQETKSGTLVVTTSHTLTARVLWRAMVRFWRMYPDFEVEVDDALTDQVREYVRSGKADLGITLAGEIPAGLDSRPLLHYSYYLLLPKVGRWGRFRPRRYRQLEEVPLLLGIPGTAYRERIDATLNRLNVRRKLRAEVATLETLPKLVTRGLGASILPGYALFEESLAGLRLCNLESEFGTETLRGVSRKTDYVRQAAVEFESFLGEELERASRQFLKRRFLTIR